MSLDDYKFWPGDLISLKSYDSRTAYIVEAQYMAKDGKNYYILRNLDGRIRLMNAEEAELGDKIGKE